MAAFNRNSQNRERGGGYGSGCRFLTRAGAAHGGRAICASTVGSGWLGVDGWDHRPTGCTDLGNDPPRPWPPRHGPACPGHLSRHKCLNGGPDKPGHDGVGTFPAMTGGTFPAMPRGTSLARCILGYPSIRPGSRHGAPVPFATARSWVSSVCSSRMVKGLRSRPASCPVAMSASSNSA